MPNALGLEHAAISQQRIEDAGKATGEGAHGHLFPPARSDAQGPGRQLLRLRRATAEDRDGSLNQEAFSPVFGDFQDMYVDVDRFTSVGAIMGSPVIDQGVLYVGSLDGNLYALR